MTLYEKHSSKFFLILWEITYLYVISSDPCHIVHSIFTRGLRFTSRIKSQSYNAKKKKHTSS